MQKSEKCNQKERKSDIIVSALIGGITLIIAQALPSILDWGENFLERAFVYLNERKEENREYKIQLEYNKTESGKEITFKNIEKISDGWLHIQGQIVIKDKNNRHLKTFHVDGMYENPNIHVKEQDTFIVHRRKCSNVEIWVEKLNHLLKEEKLDDELTVEQIGFASLSVQTKDQKGWKDQYFLLEGESLVQIDDTTAEKKEHGVYLSEEIFESDSEQKKIIEETRKCLKEIVKK